MKNWSSERIQELKDYAEDEHCWDCGEGDSSLTWRYRATSSIWPHSPPSWRPSQPRVAQVTDHFKREGLTDYESCQPFFFVFIGTLCTNLKNPLSAFIYSLRYVGNLTQQILEQRNQKKLHLYSHFSCFVQFYKDLCSKIILLSIILRIFVHATLNVGQGFILRICP